MALTVYGATLSPFVRKVCVVLAEKGLQYTLVQAGPMKLPGRMLPRMFQVLMGVSAGSGVPPGSTT